MGVMRKMGDMPGMPKTELTNAGRKQLAAAEARMSKAEGDLDAARAAWAELTRRLGISAVAREMDLTPQSLSERVKTIERNAGKR